MIITKLKKNDQKSFDRYLYDIQKKGEIEKKSNEHEHELNLQQKKDEFNANIKHSNNIKEEKIEKMNLEEIKNKNLINYKINELNYEKIKSNNESKNKKKEIEYKCEEEICKKQNLLINH